MLDARLQDYTGGSNQRVANVKRLALSFGAVRFPYFTGAAQAANDASVHSILPQEQ